MLSNLYNEELAKTYQKEIRGPDSWREDESRRTQIVDRSLAVIPYWHCHVTEQFNMFICWFFYTFRYQHLLWQEKQICQEKVRTFKTMRGKTSTENIGKVCKWKKWFSHAVASQNQWYDSCRSKISSFVLCRVYPPQKIRNKHRAQK